VSLIVEIVVCREINYNKTYASAGYANCAIFNFSPSAQQTAIKSGTPRLLGSLESSMKASQGVRKGKAMLTWDIKEYNSLIPI
jgi:hypothetical protein